MWDECDEFIKSEHGDSDMYSEEHIAWVSKEKGIKGVYGKVKGGEDWEIKSYMFMKNGGWTDDKAKGWFKTNHDDSGWIYCESDVKEYTFCDVKDENGKALGEMLIDGIAVSTDISNEHRFPAEILKTNQTLVNQPMIEQHSFYPWQVLWSDMYGKLEGIKPVDMGLYDKDSEGNDHILKGKPNVELHFKGRLFDEKMIKVVKEFPERIKFSVGFKHSFYLEEYPSTWKDHEGKEHNEIRYVTVSKEVKFDHLGIVTHPADGRAILKSDIKGENNIYDEAPISDEVIGENFVFLEGGIKVEEEAIKILQTKLVELEKSNKDFEVVIAELKKEKEDLSGAMKSATDKIKEVSEERDGYANELSVMREEVRFAELETYIDDCISKGIYTPAQKENIIKQYSGFSPEQFELQKSIDDASTPKVPMGESGLFAEKDDETVVKTIVT